MKKTQKDFFSMNDYTHSTKADVRKQLIADGYVDVTYSGKDKGFYAKLK